MKKIFIIMFLMTLMMGCSTTQIKHLTAKEFLKQTEDIKRLNSAYSTSYIGETSKRVYLEHISVITSAGDNNVIIYWTEKSNLSKDNLNKIATSFCLGSETILKNELTTLNLKHPEQDVIKNLSKNDKRFIGLYGYTLELPRVPDENKKDLKMKYGVRVIKGTSDSIESEAHGDLIVKARKYARKYNLRLIEVLKENNKQQIVADNKNISFVITSTSKDIVYGKGGSILIRCSWRNIGKNSLTIFLKDHDDYHGTMDYPALMLAKVVDGNGTVLTRNSIGGGWWTLYYLSSRLSGTMVGDIITLQPGEEVIRIVPLEKILNGHNSISNGLPKGEYNVTLKLGNLISNQLNIKIK